MLILFVLELERDLVWKDPVYCTRVKARLLCDGLHLGLCIQSLLMERGATLPHTHIDTNIRKFKVQVESRSCRIPDLWMLGSPH